jgi:hypothetical protein
MSSFVVWAPQNCRSVLEEATIGYRVGSGTVCVPIQVEEYLSQDQENPAGIGTRIGHNLLKTPLNSKVSSV